jgi:Tat protein translocase TatB subunit
MFGIGWPEMILILIVALIAVGPKKLPEMAKTLGKAMGELRKAGQELKDSIGLDDEIKQVRQDAADAISGIQNSEEFDPQQKAIKSEAEEIGNPGAASADPADQSDLRPEAKKQDGQ